MTIKEKISLLNRYAYADREINRLLDEKKRWEERATSISPVYSDAPKSHGSDKIADSVAKIIETEQKIDAAIDDNVRLRELIARAVSSLQDEKQREVIWCKYIGGMTFEETAIAVEKSERQVRRIHGQAIYNIAI